MTEVTESGFSATARRTVAIDYGMHGPEVETAWRSKPQRAARLVLKYTAHVGMLTVNSSPSWELSSATLQTRDVLKSGELGAMTHEHFGVAHLQFAVDAIREHMPRTVVTITETE